MRRIQPPTRVHIRTGQPVSTTRDGQRLDWRFDGALPLSEASSGAVRGAVSWKYDSDFRVTDVAVSDAGVSYSYDTGLAPTAAKYSTRFRFGMRLTETTALQELET